MDRTVIDHIKDNVNLLELIIEYGHEVNVRSGQLRCYVHDEKTPSMKIYDDHVHCFGCGYRDDIIGLVQREEGISFLESLRWLNDKYNLELDGQLELDDKTKKIIAMKNLSDRIAQYCYEAFISDESLKEQRQFMRDKGFISHDIELWKIGYCKEHNLHEKINATVDEMLELGFYMPHEKKPFINLFYRRILFPITEKSGKTIGFGGRTLDAKSSNKYVNTTETIIYKKNKTLYGLDKAKNSINKSKIVYVVEGYTDVMNLHKIGIQNVVASCGTALTDSHFEALSNLTDAVVLMYDGDKAGKNSMYKTIENNLDSIDKIEVKELELGSDPGEIKIEEFESIEKVSAPVWMVSYLKEISESNQAAYHQAIEFLKSIKSFPVLQSDVINAISSTYGIPINKIRQQAKVKKNKIIVKEQKSQKTTENRNVVLDSIWEVKDEYDIPVEWFQALDYENSFKGNPIEASKLYQYVISLTLESIDNSILSFENLTEVKKAGKQKNQTFETMQKILQIWTTSEEALKEDLYAF